jgi:membrane protein required for colicin V production
MMAIAAFDPHSGLLHRSQLAPYFLRQAHAVSFVVPQHLRQQLTEGARRLKEKTPGVLNPTMPPQ